VNTADSPYAQDIEIFRELVGAPELPELTQLEKDAANHRARLKNEDPADELAAAGFYEEAGARLAEEKTWVEQNAPILKDKKIIEVTMEMALSDAMLKLLWRKLE
jgi:hypothetical protein